MFTGKASPLSQQGIDTVLGRLGVDAPALWAVLTVETSGCGFLPDRRPKILFERHCFSRLTKGRFDGQAPDISNRSAGGYGDGGAFQYERLTRAMALDREAALESTSWGLGQVMGFNAARVGFADVDALVSACEASEDAQLDAMAGFIEQGHLAPHLRNADWVQFAFHYNGQDFQKNKYDEKLALAHKRYQLGPLPDLTVRTVQLALMLLGYGGARFVDGWYGQATQKALVKYQLRAGLPASGVPDDATMARLSTNLGW
ncbi:N-acetylmuramidase domain-containing protein [Polaromonas sp.]|uniref:N-acetylmuramidase domain-containing protein n=1 Tax=Polaromonas sp. TaxID=1869339 RepID=UPI002487D958|nr:N-acetylmuramidase domain-containing protein [Polaromonas sp.]MDI1338438.1 N-acetylmuramidase domain-containing protein [Polaromonas sp.]